MTEQKRTENLVNELSPDELNSVTGGMNATPPKTKTPTPPARPGPFEVEDYSFDY